MKITYTGRQVELAPAELKKIESQFAKVGKLLDGKGEREAHVVLSLERHLHNAEVTLNYHNHSLVGLASNADMFTAIHSAVVKLEKQAIKVRSKWRDTKRDPRNSVKAPVEAPPEPEAESETGKKIYRVNHLSQRKPMTLDEAILEMEGDREYLVYRDAQRDTISVLLRRRDGNFDLIEC